KITETSLGPLCLCGDFDDRLDVAGACRSATKHRPSNRCSRLDSQSRRSALCDDLHRHRNGSVRGVLSARLSASFRARAPAAARVDPPATWLLGTRAGEPVAERGELHEAARTSI